MLWYTEPFDRHDWYVDGGDKVVGADGSGSGSSSGSGGNDGDTQEEPRRYVIDFYSGESGGEDGAAAAADAATPAATTAAAGTSIPPRPPSMYIDVRPALDGPDAVVDRMKMFVRDAFPGLSAAFGMDGGDGGASTGTSASARANADADADAGGANGSGAGASASAGAGASS